MSLCNICPMECNADRNEKVGRCGVGNTVRVARAAAHLYEEPCISGKNGSGTVFFSGCNLGCVFCQNADISKNMVGKDISVAQLTDIFKRLAESGVHNINLVTPTHYTPQIVKALERFNRILPVVWNSSGYEKVETLKMLNGLVDVYMPDLKYGDNLLSMRYSGVADYFDIATAAIEEMFRQTGKYSLNDDGMLQRGVIVRHLVLPEAYENTRLVLDYLSKDFEQGDILFSLMGQYTPMPQALKISELSRRLTESEYKWAKNYMHSCGITDGFTQSLSSAEEIYIPEFDLTGVLKG